MRWTRAALTVGLAWLAVNLLLKGRRAEPPEGDDRVAPWPSVDSSLTRGPVAAAVGGGPAPVVSDDATASAPERGAPGADSQESPYPGAPGLTDFARGA
ncbi:MAG TPA: hypothetical protein VGK95_04550 [Caldimonas sp.]|jgi:hypothetical protein